MLTQCLREIVARTEGGTAFITIEGFSILLKWFGPLKPDAKCAQFAGTVLERLVGVLAQRWFFGAISSEEATDKLAPYQHQKGTFLVRLNPGGKEPIEKSPFTISRVNEAGAITHIRIRPSTQGYSCSFPIDGEARKVKYKGNFVQFMAQLRHDYPSVFQRECSSYPYDRIFTPRQRSLTASNGYGDDMHFLTYDAPGEVDEYH